MKREDGNEEEYFDDNKSLDDGDYLDSDNRNAAADQIGDQAKLIMPTTLIYLLVSRIH